MKFELSVEVWLSLWWVFLIVVKSGGNSENKKVQFTDLLRLQHICGVFSPSFKEILVNSSG
jgi:hypothetical protein